MRKLIPDTLLEQVPNLYATKKSKDPLCHIKLFTPDASSSWYITEFSREDNHTCFGYIIGLEKELGYFSLNEIENVRGALGLAVERDIHFTPTLLSEVKRGN